MPGKGAGGGRSPDPGRLPKFTRGASQGCPKPCVARSAKKSRNLPTFNLYRKPRSASLGLPNYPPTRKVYKNRNHKSEKTELFDQTAVVINNFTTSSKCGRILQSASPSVKLITEKTVIPFRRTGYKQSMFLQDDFQLKTSDVSKSKILDIYIKKIKKGKKERGRKRKRSMQLFNLGGLCKMKRALRFPFRR